MTQNTVSEVGKRGLMLSAKAAFRNQMHFSLVNYFTLAQGGTLPVLSRVIVKSPLKKVILAPVKPIQKGPLKKGVWHVTPFLTIFNRTRLPGLSPVWAGWKRILGLQRYNISPRIEGFYRTTSLKPPQKPPFANKWCRIRMNFIPDGQNKLFTWQDLGPLLKV